MIYLKNISFGYTSEKLFSNLDLEIFKNDKIGLVGRNGSGKTTLLRILAGEISDYEGIITTTQNISIGYLPQQVHFLKDDFTPFTLCKQAFKEIDQKLKRIEFLSTRLDNENYHKEYDFLLYELSENNQFSYEYKIRMVLSSLGLSLADMNTSFGKLSSGYKVRAYLGYLILLSPDLLLLDEPTNFLDIDAIQYLIEFLKSYNKSFIIVSHDKNILDTAVNKIWDLFAGNLYLYNNCNYSGFIKRKDEYLLNLEKRSNNLDKKIKQQLEFINRFRSKESKASAVQSRIKLLEKLEKIDIPSENSINFKIQSSNNTFSNILSCENLSFGFSSEKLLEKIHFSILRKDRIFLIGKNGIGKTTFLKLLVGELKPEEGKVVVHNNAKVGYFEQNASIDAGKIDRANELSVIEFFTQTKEAQNLSETERKSFLGNFGFTDNDFYKPISFLSGGEKVRLILAKIFLTSPDILILDEPTTHLDISTKEVLIGNLYNYNGALLCVSHDIDFIKRLAKKFITIEDKNLKWFDSLQYYFEILEEKKAKNEKKIFEIKKEEKKEEKKGLSTNKRQQIEKKIMEYEKEILEVEKKINDIEKKFEQNLSFGEIQKLNEIYNNLNRQYEELFSNLIKLEESLK
ncbi:MAG: ABC-F family ATP-binding cassette domain-containing protein [Exilispira sp.]